MTTMRPSLPDFLRFELVVVATVVVLGILGSGSSTTNFGVWSVTASSTADVANAKASSIPSQILRARMPSRSGGGDGEQQQQQQQQQQQLWMFEGALYDPLDGRQVANVQGIELVRPLHDTSHLAIDTLLRHPNATYVDAKTVWSQKIFCYTKPTATTTASTAAAAAAAAGEDQSRTREDILRSVRIRPQSPQKKVPLDQAVAVYETATTFVSRTKQSGGKSRADNTGDEDEDELLVHSEWPNGQTMWGMAAQGGSQRQRSKNNNNNNNNDNMDFTVFAKLRNKHSPLYAPDLIPDPDEVARSRTRNRTGADGDVIVSPKRAALVQFGSSDKTMESKHKFGARETYSYRNIASSASVGGSGRWWPRSPLESWLRRIRPSATTSGGGDGSRTSVHYTRYGEGPPFYAPGRMCMLELRGRPIRDLDEATPLLKDLLRKDGGPVANFHWTAAATAAPSIQMAWNRKEASTTYRAGDGLPGRTSSARTRRASNTNTNTQHLLRLDVPEDDGDGEGERGGIGKRLGAWTRRGKQRAEVVWDRLKAATSMESAGS